MEDKLKSTLDDFLSEKTEKETEETDEEFTKKVKNQKKELLKSDFTIVERIDRIFVTPEGKQLLREIY